MKKYLIISVGALMMLSSCGTYTGSGAYAGSGLGAILGSAIGGIAGGPRGSDLGTIIGMAGGAAVGAAIGAQADQKAADEVHEHYERVQERRAQRDGYQYGGGKDTYYSPDVVVDETGSGDDRLYDFHSSDYTGNYSAGVPTTTMPATSSVDELASGYNYTPTLEIMNARFVDDNQDGVLSGDETGKIIFEIRNNSKTAVYDVQPSVVEANNNRRIYISPSIHVERIAPGRGIRYTAMVKAQKNIRNGNARFCLSVLHGGKNISKVTAFTIPTKRR